MLKNREKKLTKYWKYIIILTIVVIFFNILARFRAFCDFYVDNIFWLWSNTYGALIGIFPFSVGGVMVIAAVIAILLAIVLSIILIFKKANEKYKCFVIKYLKVLLSLGLIAGLLMTLNCSTLYRCSKINANGREYTKEELTKVYEYVVDRCNELSEKFNRNEYSEVVYDGNLKTAVKSAVKKISETNKRYRGYTPYPKKFINSYVYYQMKMLGEYYPFSMEANYSKYMTDLNIASTVCHEISHLKGYIYEDEADFMSYLTCVESDDEFLQYAGYLNSVFYLLDDLLAMCKESEKSSLKVINDAVYFDYNTVYKKIYKDKLVKKKPIVPTDVVEQIGTTITEAYLDYYNAEANYAEMTKLLLWYYDGILF